MLRQISIVAENKRGTLENITGLLLREQVNIWGSVVGEHAEYGLIRMVVSDTDKALAALQREGYLCKAAAVLGVEVADEVGNLHHLLEALDESNIGVDYMYLSFSRESGKPIMVFHAQDCYEVEECLMMKGFTLV